MTEERETEERAASGLPARGYSWPPFEDGNLAAARHGAYSERLLAQTTDEILAEAVEALPFLAAPEYRAEVQAWARAEARVRRLSDWLDEHGDIDPETNDLRASLTRLATWERLAAERRAALGLTPTARAKLEAIVAAGASNLDDLRERGRAIRERREAEERRAASEGKRE